MQPTACLHLEIQACLVDASCRVPCRMEKTQHSTPREYIPIVQLGRFRAKTTRLYHTLGPQHGVLPASSMSCSSANEIDESTQLGDCTALATSSSRRAASGKCITTSTGESYSGKSNHARNKEILLKHSRWPCAGRDLNLGGATATWLGVRRVLPGQTPESFLGSCEFPLRAR